MSLRPAIAFLLIVAAASAQDPSEPPASGTSKRPIWKDPSDGWLDLSALLERPGRFFPLAVPITEPAVGVGLAGGAVFLRPRVTAGNQGWTRPNISLAGGLYTSNGSWAAVMGDSSVWRNGRLETFFAGGYASLNLKFFDASTGSPNGETGVGYNLTAAGGAAQGKIRLGRSKFLAGIRYIILDVATRPSGAGTESLSNGVNRSDRIAGPSVSLTHDSRNNFLSPTKGIYSETSFSYFDPAVGGSINFQRLDQVTFGYIPLHAKVTLGIRGDAGFSFRDPVFYARPYVSLRGVPALRYQRQHLLQTESELQWRFWNRLSAVGFGGVARVWNSGDAGGHAKGVGAGGGGFRYEIARKFGLHCGIDVARGPEQWAFYFVFGSAWARP
jgi:hypothetical protein